MSFAAKMKNATPGRDVWDRGERASVPGLHVRAKAKDRRVFMFYYRPEGVLNDKGKPVQRRIRIGDVGPMTPGEARAAAAKLAATVALGGDPMGDRREVAKDQLTVGDLWQLADVGHYQSETADPRSWASEAGRLWAAELKATFAGRRVRDMERGDVIKWRDRYKKERTVTGNRALSVLRRVFSWAIERGEIKYASPCTGVEPHPERERRRYAVAEEIARFGAILERDAATEPRAVAFILLLIYTGARPMAIAKATWDQLSRVAVDGKTVGVLAYEGKSTSKTGQLERVVLPAAALAVIDRLPRVTGDDRIVGLSGVPRKYWEKARKEAGCPDLWARDWRRTFATVGLSSGEVSLDVIGRVLNHHNPQTTLRYADAIPTARVQAVNTIAGQLEQLLGAGREAKP